MALEHLILANLDKGVLVAVRVGMLMTFAPFFGSTAIPMPVKAALTVGITAVLVPNIRAFPAVSSPVGWVQLVAGEAVVGLVIGLVMDFALEGIELAGEVAGFQLGFSVETAIDPTTQAASSAFTVLYQTLALLFFLQLGVHRWMLVSLAKTFEWLPLGAASVSRAGMTRLMHASGAIFLIGVELAAPIILVTVLTDLSLGFINKASPQFPVMFTSIAVKSLLGFTLVMISLGFWHGLLGGYFRRALAETVSVLHM
jgi:flagellar biosynthesis protein FliR